jgi:hypothetical protein
MEKCEHQKVSKQSGKRAYASKYLGNCHPDYLGFNTSHEICLNHFPSNSLATFSSVV